MQKIDEWDGGFKILLNFICVYEASLVDSISGLLLLQCSVFIVGVLIITVFVVSFCIHEECSVVNEVFLVRFCYFYDCGCCEMQCCQ